MSLKLNSSGGGSVTLQEPSTATNGTLTLPAGTGTVAVNGLSSNIVSGTAQASTSGTAINFTDIPSWAKRITVMFNGVSTNGTGNYQIQLGTGATPTFVTSGYTNQFMTTGASTMNTVLQTNGFCAVNPASAGVVHSGALVLSNLSGFTWTGVGSFAETTGTRMFLSSGAYTLSAALTAVRVTTTSGTDTFDAGSINILYE